MCKAGGFHVLTRMQLQLTLYQQCTCKSIASMFSIFSAPNSLTTCDKTVFTMLSTLSATSMFLSDKRAQVYLKRTTT